MTPGAGEVKNVAQSRAARSRYLRLLVLACLALVVFGGRVYASEQELRVPTAETGVPGHEQYLENKDQEEEAKLAETHPTQLWFRNGYTVRPAPGLHPQLNPPLSGFFVLQVPGPIQKAWRETIGATIGQRDSS